MGSLIFINAGGSSSVTVRSATSSLSSKHLIIAVGDEAAIFHGDEPGFAAIKD
jgi:hypothetical protein